MAPTAAATGHQASNARTAVVVVALLFVTMLIVLSFEATLLGVPQTATHTTTTTEEKQQQQLLGEDEFTGQVSAADRLHLSLLQNACRDNTEAILHWSFGKPGVDQLNMEANQKTVITRDDPELLAKLRQCPDIDMFVPSGIRGYGYCEDAIVYAKFLETRLLPMWAIDTPLFDPELNRTVTYHELCPKTPILMLNHYWDGVPSAPAFPKDKPVYMMPNIEMHELTEELWWTTDVVLCKTQTCYDRVTKWYAQEGNKRNTKVWYTRHTTSDFANFARTHFGVVKPKDYTNVRFTHIAGGSSQKGTMQVLDCWLSRPDFPPLDFYVAANEWKANFEAKYANRIRATPNINLTDHNLDPPSFGKVVAETSFFLCTSRMEGYGHYINQARASGGVILTTDAPPMNELIQDGMGVYVATKRTTDRNQILGGAFRGRLGLKNVDGMIAQFSSEDVCRGVEHVVYNTTLWERLAMATKAQQQYHIDTKFFARRMQELRQFAKEGGTTEALAAIQLRREQGQSPP